jgi:rhodanese-related sulfurtransferase
MKMKILHLFKVLCFTYLVSFSLASYGADDFPGRKSYPNIPYIEISDLYNNLNNVVLIDARSPYEFNTLKMLNAINLPFGLSADDFKDNIMDISRIYPDKRIVFYCNGHKCMKSYKAARRAIVYAKLSNVFVFDAGIFEWAKKYPDHAKLLGRSPVRYDELISREEFNMHLIPVKEFIKSATDQTIVLDIRSRVQRDGLYIFSGYEESITLNDNDRYALDAVIEKVKKSSQPLYVYDAVGKQVRWFQYYLKSKGVKNYFFMEGGVAAFIKIPMKVFLDS